METRLADPPVRDAPAGRPPRARGLFALPEVRWAAIALALFAAAAVLQLAGASTWTWWTLYLACYAAGGWEPGLAGLRALRAGSLDVDLLMVLAALLAAAIGQVLDGALLIIIFATSGALEAIATKRTRDSVTALLDLAPEQATLLDRARDGDEDWDGDGDGDWEGDGAAGRAGDAGRGGDAARGGERIVDVAVLQVGDVIVVRPGERIGADGAVVAGASDVDQSSITGEPMPVAKHPGDEVYAGTLNGVGALRVRVAAPAQEAVIARIAAQVAEASETKANAQLFIEKVEQRYSIGMVAATVALFVVPLAFGAALAPTLLRAITFMIVASPCAVVLATMPPLLSAIANAGRRGVLVKSAVVMERLGTVDQVAFDKTGTLTLGEPEVVAVQPIGEWTADGALRLAGAVEQLSEHPVGRAIARAARDHGLETQPAEDFVAIPGEGVRGVVGGSVVHVMAPRHLTGGDERGLVERIESDGATAVVVAVDGAASAVIGLRDQVRPDAAAAVARLAELTGHPPALLTGDHQQAAAHLGDLVGIRDARGGLLPHDKVAAVRAWQGEQRSVLVIGDGVNDAPAMAAADLGLAMGRRGSDLALQTADAVIVRDELSAVPRLVRLSRRARRLVIANLCFAATVIVCLVAWDLIGHLPLPLAVAGHEGSTVVVGLNGLRLLRRSAWERGD